MFVTYTEWIEVERFIWVCHGCSRECEIGSKERPQDQQECDHSEERVKEIIAPYGAQLGGAW